MLRKYGLMEEAKRKINISSEYEETRQRNPETHSDFRVQPKDEARLGSTAKLVVEFYMRDEVSVPSVRKRRQSQSMKTNNRSGIWATLC